MAHASPKNTTILAVTERTISDLHWADVSIRDHNPQSPISHLLHIQISTQLGDQICCIMCGAMYNRFSIWSMPCATDPVLSLGNMDARACAKICAPPLFWRWLLTRPHLIATYIKAMRPHWRSVCAIILAVKAGRGNWSFLWTLGYSR